MFPGRLETIIFLKITQIFPVPAKKNNTSQVTVRDYAIGQHLLENSPCASQYSDTKLSILILKFICSSGKIRGK